jgi:hypothetical protein
MARSVYNWIIVYDDGSTEITQADNPMDAIEFVEKDWYCEGVRAVIKMDYA